MALGQLPEPERFAQLASVRKQLMDTLRMIAYRAETALALLVRDVLRRDHKHRFPLRGTPHETQHRKWEG